MIHVQQLYYDYPGCRALDNIRFDLPPGSITALVGPNGAGKTTLLRILAGLEEPMAGSVVIDGIDVQQEPRQVHLRTGYLPDHFGLYQDLSARRCLIYAARAHGLSDAQADAAAAWAIGQVGLGDLLDKRAGTLSRGQRQRLALAQAIVHRPKVLLLDEPGSGLDPESRSNLSTLMKNLAADGMTLLISSHILAELETYCTAMLVLRGGRLLDHQRLGQQTAQETAPHSQRALPTPLIRLRLLASQQERLAELRDWLQQQNGQASFDGTGAILFPAPHDETAQADLLHSLLAAGWRITEYAVQSRSLQDVYLQTVAAQTPPGDAP